MSDGPNTSHREFHAAIRTRWNPAFSARNTAANSIQRTRMSGNFQTFIWVQALPM